MITLKHLLGCGAISTSLLLSPGGRAAVYTYTFAPTESGAYLAGWSGSQAIPDNTAAGVAYALNFGAGGEAIHDVTLSFNVSGGWNGDLYAYLSHGSGFAVLLNRVGASASDPDGYSTSGLNVVLTTGSLNPDIHGVPGPAEGGSYQADGRLNYADTTRNNTLDVFNNMDPYGSWTLFFADRAGGNIGTLTGWSLEITTTPEPVNVALGVFGTLLVAWRAARWRRARAKP